jgi:tRNA-uridine 2-sulfurtransferase
MVIIAIMAKIKQNKKVFVGISGGVDSAVSAALLKKQGYNVVGVFIRTWHPDFIKCTEEEERIDSMRICAHLDIPFLTFDFKDVYKKEVADYMIREYKMGRTPNPDVMCNKEVKFGAFLKKALAMGADYVATGHYARVAQVQSKKYKVKSKNSQLSTFNFQLYTGLDSTKDQTYFLWTLRQEQLSKILFPIGHLKKTEVRKLAKKLKLPVAGKKDSQGICFLGAVDLKDFLKHYIKEKKGKVILAPRSLGVVGEVVGFHDGAVFHTLGERHGFTITKKKRDDGAYYIVGKDIKKNILYVSQNKNFVFSAQNYKKLSYENIAQADRAEHSNFSVEKYARFQKEGFLIILSNTNWILEIPKPSKNYTCQIRYHGEFLPCRIKIKNKKSAKIIFKKPILAASGQSCVIYDKDICLGGGVIV